MDQLYNPSTRSKSSVNIPASSGNTTKRVSKNFVKEINQICVDSESENNESDDFSSSEGQIPTQSYGNNQGF